MLSRFLGIFAATVAVAQLCGCAYIDIAGGAYESTRSREAGSRAGTSGGTAQTLPKHEDYERERAKIRGASKSAEAQPPAVSPP
jgi:hypothetical protein